MHSEELFDIVNEADEVIGQATRRECHGHPALVHRAVHVLVFNRVGDLLLQKRSIEKDIQPGKWDTSVGGHLDRGESYLAAARREMQEELGLSGLPLTFLYPSRIRNEVESENIETYLAMTDQPVVFNPTEISEIRFWCPAEIDQSSGNGVLTPNFEEEWQMFKEFLRKFHSETVNHSDLCAGDSMPDLIATLAADQSTGRTA